MITLPTSDQKKMCEIVDRRQPTYQDFIAHWNFCESTFDGGRDWFLVNIHEYLKEGTREYADRLGRAYRFNHTKEIVKLITKYLFKMGVIRNTEDASDEINQFWKHSTLDGSPIDVLMKQVSDMSSVNGRVWVVIDSKLSGTAPITVADQKNNQSRIYAYLIKQEDMLDFARDDFGELLWVKFRIKHRDDADPVNSTGTVATRYVIWTRDSWVLLEEKIKGTDVEAGVGVAIMSPDSGTSTVLMQGVVSALTDAQAQAAGMMSTAKEREIVVISIGENLLGEVPVVPVDHVENSKPYSPPGLIDDIAYLDRACANYLSNLDAIIQDQTFSQLIMPAQGFLPGEEAYDKLVESGTKRIFVYDGEANNKPEYISPDASNAQIIMTVIKTIIGEIYHSVGMAGERTKQDNAQGSDNSSGVAKAYDFDRMNSLLVAKAAQLQRAEDKILYFVDRYGGNVDSSVPGTTPTTTINDSDYSEEADPLIKYPDTFDIRGLPDEFDLATSLMVLAAPDSVRRQQMQNIITKLFPRLAKDLLDQMQSELKDWPVDPMDTLAEQLAVTSKFSTGSNTVNTKGTPANVPEGGSGGANESAGSSTPTPGKTAPGSNKQGQDNSK